MADQTEGARLLQCVKGSLAEIAARLDPAPARQLVGRWRSGETLPSAEYRTALEKAFAIPKASWDRRTGATTPPTTKEAVEPFQGSAVEELRRTVAQLTRKLEALEGDPDVSPAHYAQVANAKTSAVAKLARLTGEDELTPQMIVRSKAWRDILATLEPIFARHPHALAEIAAALRSLEQ